jgi:hypothetical protein
MSPLKEIVDGIHAQVAKIEDDLKVFIFFPLSSFCSIYLFDFSYEAKTRTPVMAHTDTPVII